jgi:hypothetical protein
MVSPSSPHAGSISSSRTPAFPVPPLSPIQAHRRRRSLLYACATGALLLSPPLPAAPGDASPTWPAPVPGFVAPKAGEHPRLLFRKADLPKLRQRAQTPEGRELIERTKFLLGGADKLRESKEYTMFDAAAFGFLYQMTGDKKYAELAKQSQDKFWTPGTTDKDARYGLVPPNEPMRVGPSMYAVALAYDLCYDGWTPEYRKEQAQKIMTWSGKCKKSGGDMNFERLAMNPANPNPVTNHFGLQVGGAGLTILALKDDPELTPEQHAQLKKFQEGVDRHARKVMTQDFGESGYFAEHAGPGVIAMTWTMTPWLKAEQVAHGRDWLADASKPTPQWMSLRFVMETLPSEKGAKYPNPSPQGGYGTEYLIQDGGHHAGYWSQGFGAIRPKYAPAMLWVYNHFVEPTERKLYPAQFAATGKSYDAFNYPHRPMYSFVNWPFGVAEENPEKTLPKFKSDTHYGRFVFRNRWQDANDTVVAVLLGARTSDQGVKRVQVWGLGQQLEFGNVGPSIQGNPKIGTVKLDGFEGFTDGSGSVAGGGNAIGVDFSKASGADAVVVIVGPGGTDQLAGSADPAKSKVQSVEAGGKKFSILTLSEKGAHPAAVAAGDTVTLGGQTISTDGTLIKFAKTAPALK